MTFRSFRVASSFMIVARRICNGLNPMVQPIAISLLTARISLYPPTSLHVNGLVIFRHLRFAGTRRIADAAEELTKTAAAFDKPAIFAVWARRIGGTAPASHLTGPVSLAWEGRAAGWAGGQKVSTVLDVLAPVPDAAILPGHTQQSPAAFAAEVSLGFCPWGCRNPVGRVFPKLGHKGRRAGVRGKDRQRMTGPRHRHIHDAPLLCVLERLLFR